MDVGAGIAQITQPTPRWFKRVDQLDFNEAVRRLLRFQELPPNRPDLFLADDDDIKVLCGVAAYHAASLVTLREKICMSHDECCATVAYTMEEPYPLFQAACGYMCCWSCRRHLRQLEETLARRRECELLGLLELFHGLQGAREPIILWRRESDPVHMCGTYCCGRVTVFGSSQ